MPSPALVDSHCHLDFPDFEGEVDAIVARAAAAGVTRMVTICTRLRQAPQVQVIAEAHPGVFWAAGTHPMHAAEEPLAEVEDLVRLAAHPKFVGIGETGLDYHYTADSAAIQQQSLRIHIEAARRTGLPLIIHARDADTDVGRILADEHAAGAFACVMHCFTAGAALAETALGLGFYLSISGIATFRTAEPLRAIFAAAPRDRLLVETDSPYLAPTPHRGKRNEPAYAADTARAMAGHLGMEAGEFARLTSANFDRIFPPRRHMTTRIRATILGCGSSTGVPRIGGDWGQCDPANPKNRRSRCSILVERISGEGVTRALVDTTPDLRFQLLASGVGVLDGVAFTHPHADHLHGIDDLRTVVHNRGGRLPVWADAPTADVLLSRFAYVFVQPAGSLYPPILDLQPLDGPFTVQGAGGPIGFQPFWVQHGRIQALGFRIGRLAYLPDVSAIPEAAWPALEGLDTLVLDALRRSPHPTHAHLAQSLAWIERAAPRLGVITNMHSDLDYASLEAELPPGVIPAYDGLELEIPL